MGPKPLEGNDPTRTRTYTGGQRQDDVIALVEAQGTLGKPLPHAQRTHVLKDAEALKERVRLGSPLVLGKERAAPRHLWLQRTLIDDDVFDLAQQLVGQKIRMPPSLRLPDRVDLRFDHRPGRIERIQVLGPFPLRAETDGAATGAQPPIGEKLAERSDPCAFKLDLQTLDPLLHRASLVVVGIGDDPVGLEASTLVEVEQSPADLGGRKTAVESLLPEGIRVEPLERLPNDPVDGHQPRPDEGLHQPIPAADEAPAPPAGVPPLGRQGSLRLRISTGLVVRGENPDAGVPHATGTASGVEIQDAPADGIGSEIQPQAVAEGLRLASGRAGPDGRIDREARFHKSPLK